MTGEELKREPSANLPGVISIPSALPLLFSSPHNIAQPKRKRLIGFSAVNWTSPLLGPFCQDPRILFEFKTELEAWEKQLTRALRNRKELFSKYPTRS